MPLAAQASFRRIVWTAFVAAVVTGLAMTLVQHFTTVPLIAKAETYEQSEPQSDAHHAAHGAAAHDHAAHNHNGWAPKDGFERTFYTGLTTVLTAFGYALMLGALLSQMRFANWRTGIALGMAGFLVFQLAPALGLPPEPPGVPMAELLPRQLWWLATVVATAAAFAAWYRARNHSKLLWIPLGAALLALPHLIGPPPAPEALSGVPHELARDFAIASLATAALFWTMLGTVQGYLFARACRAT